MPHGELGHGSEPFAASQQRLGLAFDPGTKVVDVYVRYLRRKVGNGEAASLSHTARGTGTWIGQGPGSQDGTAGDS